MLTTASLKGFKHLLLYLPQVGVGTSTLQLDLVQQAGFTLIVNTDYSPVCIRQMSEAHADLAPTLTYRCGLHVFLCPLIPS